MNTEGDGRGVKCDSGFSLNNLWEVPFTLVGERSRAILGEPLEAPVWGTLSLRCLLGIPMGG